MPARNTAAGANDGSRSRATAPSDSPDLIATRSSSESRTVDAWTTLEYSSHEPDALSRRLKLDWRQTASLYFQTVHPWFSILRQDKFEEALLRLHPQDDAYELLIICMHLLTTTAHTHGDDDIIVNPLYQNAKQRFASVSYLSDPTLEWIQAGLLISLFEFGNGKTKLAYRSLSETATLARLAGVNPGQYQKDLHSEFDVDAECRRALWWGIFILDQFAHLDPALRNLPSLSSSPDNDALLPTAGVVVDGDRLQSYVANLPVSAPVSIALGGFQRAAQAATVLYQAREWDRRVRQGDADRGVSSFEDLDGRIRALLDAMLNQCHRWEVFCDALAMCISSLFVLYAPYLPPQSISAPLANDTKSCDEAKAVAAIGFAVKFVGDLAVNFNSQISQHALRLANLAPPAPFACFLAVEHMHVVEGDLPDSSERYLEIFETLKTFGKRWKVAADLLDLALHVSVPRPSPSPDSAQSTKRGLYKISIRCPKPADYMLRQ
ncbi:C6 transcription factor [Purpureocillium lilacinum]|uniref:C6 transcription factor n=1 Tax=Purpureocillium lilacinum TaxID=33203 RepID=A0A2U3EAP2_PURLI|nr:C6 transcription factor [Purpureocillium lilacinum]